MHATPLCAAPHLDTLHARIRQAHPRARVDDVEEEGSGFPGFRVVLPNGVDLVVGVDLDRPMSRFEVVREQAGAWAGDEHLSADGVIAVLRRYARLAS